MLLLQSQYSYTYTLSSHVLPPYSDHFDQHVESSLRRSLPIITTPHAKSHLASKGEGEAFTSMYDLDFFDEMLVDVKDSNAKAAFKVTGMPGSHVPVGPAGLVGKANELAGAVSPQILASRSEVGQWVRSL